MVKAIQQLKEENDRLKEGNEIAIQNLKEENDRLKEGNEIAIQNLKEENDRLKEKFAGLEQIVAQLKANANNVNEVSLTGTN